MQNEIKELILSRITIKLSTIKELLKQGEYGKSLEEVSQLLETIEKVNVDGREDKKDS